MTGNILTYRERLEQTIIGQLVSNKYAYQSIADILRPHHFKNNNARNVYVAIENLYTKYPIDLLTVTKQTNALYWDYLIGCITSVASSCHLSTHAYHLWELNIRENGKATLNPFLQHRLISNEGKAKLGDIISHLNDLSGDVLFTVDIITLYLSKELPDFVAETWNQFATSINKEIRQLREQQKAALLINSIQQLSGSLYDKESKEALNKLINLTLSTLATRRMDPVLAQSIMQL